MSFKHVTLPLCCFNVGPASLTMGQHLTNTCSISRLCWGPFPEWVTAWDNAVPANTRQWINAGLMLAQRLRRWPNISPALVQCLVLARVLLDDVIIFSHFNKSFYQRPWMGFAWLNIGQMSATFAHHWLRWVVIVDQARCYGDKPFHYDDLAWKKARTKYTDTDTTYETTQI